MASNIDLGRIARRILIIFLALDLAALVFDYVFNYYDVFNDISIRRMFNIAREQSIPTWVASTQAGGLGLTAWLVSRTEAAHSWLRRAWMGVAVFFVYVGMDDAAEIHERVGSALERKVAEGTWIADYPSYAWQVFLAPLLAAGLFGSAVLIWFRMPDRRSRLFVALCLIGFAVAQGLDYIEADETFFLDLALRFDEELYTITHAFKAAEEVLEMLATTSLWAPMLWHLRDRLRGTTLDLV